MQSKVLFCLAYALTLAAPVHAEESDAKVRSIAFSDLLKELETRQPRFMVASKDLSKNLAISICGVDVDRQTLEGFSAGLRALGKTKSIRFTARTKPSTLRGLASDKTYRLTLGIDHSNLIAEIGTVLDEIVGVKDVLENILTGIANDGPKVDIEMELLVHLGRECVLMNETSERNFRWLAAIQSKNDTELAAVIEKLMTFQPGSELVRSNHFEVGQTAIFVGTGWLLIGDKVYVRNAIPRL